ncbi:8-oxo-dGTP pyrophosphatase MutT (NUDIX family) [Kribbella aluminosa]|uniref:8-oxo-dGTP pyrophosphatase MutT (NUDIX family) n=1 Tax=Kribbella aluminosa TaxID=416017 RepID=A0ABS4UT93_9ACTN|nr:NUDIX domain-containing protein [Kribbella aluminosa]MBP2354857.1 8-oxo-dGTP pyrophosphatase MutT (NUDIX family) [Kribbella aluminosa]
MGSPFLQLWWRIRKPTTFGVKALLRLPDGRFLVVRHSYADTHRWALPGGGYKPARETPAQAAAREVHEELGLVVPADAFQIMRSTVTTLEGKHDTLTILTACAPDDSVTRSAEIAEARWVRNLQELGDAPRSKWLLSALIE